MVFGEIRLITEYTEFNIFLFNFLIDGFILVILLSCKKKKKVSLESLEIIQQSRESETMHAIGRKWLVLLTFSAFPLWALTSSLTLPYWGTVFLEYQPNYYFTSACASSLIQSNTNWHACYFFFCWIYCSNCLCRVTFTPNLDFSRWKRRN